VRDQHVEKTNKLGGRRIDRRRDIASREKLQPPVVARHETFEQGSIHAMKVAGCVRHGEHRLQVHVKGGVAEGRKIDEGGLAVCRLQG
jgi:hypothetical protein